MHHRVHLNFRTTASSIPFAIENTVKSPPISAQTLVRKWYSGVVFSEMITIIGEIWKLNLAEG